MPIQDHSVANRRTFLKATAGVAALLKPLARADAAATGKREIHKAIMYETVGLKGSVLEKFQAVKAAGLKGSNP